MSEKATPQLVPVKLLKAHRHAGRDYKPGQTIKLAPHKADWLISQDVAQAAKEEPLASVMDWAHPAPAPAAAPAIPAAAAPANKPKKD